MFETTNGKVVKIRILLILALLVLLASMISIVYAFTLLDKDIQSSPSDPEPMVYIGAGVAVGLSCIGAGYALSSVAKAGFAAIVEKPELRGFFLIIAGLAEGIAIYGLLIAILMIMFR